jgi:hypothetical protein
MTGTQQGRSTIDAKRAEDVKRLELEDARKQEKRTAVAETKQTAQEIADRERQYRAQARKARKARQREKKEAGRRQSEEEKAEELEDTTQVVYTMGPMVESKSTALPKPPSETVIEEIEAIRAAYPDSGSDSTDTFASSSSSKPSKQPLPKSVDAIVATRIQVLKEQAGDYSRYLPGLLAVGRTPGSVGPAAYAELILARTRGARLRKRREAVQVVEKLVGMRDARIEI